MNSKDKEDFQELVHKIFDERRSIDEVTHLKQHEWITVQMEAAEKRKEFYAAMRIHLAKWGMLAVASWVFYALWYYFKHNVNNVS